MTIKEKQANALDMIEEQKQSLLQAYSSGGLDPNAGKENIKRWKERTNKLILKHINQQESDKFMAIRVNKIVKSPLQWISLICDQYRAFFDGLGKTIAEHPEDIFIQDFEEEVIIAADDKTEIKYNDKEVFIVHGRDEEAKEKVARFIEKFDLNPIILHEKASKGMTIIEKIEHYSDVGFAIVLLTPDDVGATKDERDQLKPRARQNVLLELGYFLGRLGRASVCALLKDSVEMPTDYKGIVYVPFDGAGAWKYQVAKEMNDAGYKIDMNKLL